MPTVSTQRRCPGWHNPGWQCCISQALPRPACHKGPSAVVQFRVGVSRVKGVPGGPGWSRKARCVVLVGWPVASVTVLCVRWLFGVRVDTCLVTLDQARYLIYPRLGAEVGCHLNPARALSSRTLIMCWASSSGCHAQISSNHSSISNTGLAGRRVQPVGPQYP